MKKRKPSWLALFAKERESISVAALFFAVSNGCQPSTGSAQQQRQSGAVDADTGSVHAAIIGPGLHTSVHRQVL